MFKIAFRIGSECPFIKCWVLVKKLTTSKGYVNVYRLFKSKHLDLNLRYMYMQRLEMIN